MKKNGLMVVGLVVVLLLLVVQQAKRMGHGAKGMAISEAQPEQVNSSVSQVEVVASGGSPAPATVSEPADSEAAVPPRQVYSEDKLSEAVKTLLGLDGKEHNYPELLEAIKALGTDLSAADVAALRDMLMFPNDRFPAKMRPIEINAVKNDVLDRLLRQKELSEGLGLQLAEMAADPGNDPVWRDYSIQFMTPFYERVATKNTKDTEGDSSVNSVSSSETGGEKSSDEMTAVKEAMFQALEERSETLAGTSLIGLELLSRTHEEFDRKLIIEKTVEVASDESASPSCRLTALRLASLAGKEQGAEGMANIADTTRSLAQTGETILLRSAAIVTLGEVGTAADREFLDTFASSDNKQIAAAARLALQKMDARE